MNLFELFVKIGVDDQASDKLKSLSSKLGNGLKTAAKIGTAAVGAAATGIAALTKEAVNNYAEYEQLVGGVETLFKKCSDKVIGYAENAYKTAGLSANEYMETVTSFSASLLQSLDGDTAAAAEKANMAITDMSDNANKMGTSMEMIQNAYNGFAKQNYTMLDNLKLGYGGTSQEMYRLLQDAANINEEFAKTANFSIDEKGHLKAGFADITQAIHIIQTEMGITGTTALEAGRTISGSVGAMKSAWTNLITGLADGNADIGELVDNLVTTIVGDGTESNLGVFGNVLPAVENAMNGASTLVSNALPKIMEIIPTIISDNLPVLAEAAVGIMQSLMDGISQNQEMLFETIFDVVKYIAESYIAMLPQIVELGLDLIVSLANGIAESLPELIPTIIDVVLQIVETLTNPETLMNLVEAAIDIILALTNGIIDAIPELIREVPKIIASITSVLLAELPTIIAAGFEILFAVINGLMEALPELAAFVPNIITGIVNILLNNLDKIILGGIQILLAVGMGLIEAIPDLILYIPRIIKSIVDTFIEYDWMSIGKNIMEGLWNGLADKIEWLKSKVKGIVEKIKNVFTSPDGFDTHSPSKWSEKVFKNVMDGGGNGLDDGLPSLIRTATGVTDDVKNALTMGDYSVPVSISGTAYASSQTNGGTTAELDSIRRDISFIASVLMNGITLDANDRELGRFVKKYATA